MELNVSVYLLLQNLNTSFGGSKERFGDGEAETIGRGNCRKRILEKWRKFKGISRMFYSFVFPLTCNEYVHESSMILELDLSLLTFSHMKTC